jgi:hypothetical protein
MKIPLRGKGIIAEADPDAVFPEPPDAKVIADVVTTGVLPQGVELQKFQDSDGW